MNNYSFLAEHFNFEFFYLKSDHPLIEKLKNYYDEINFDGWKDYKYGSAFIEKQSGHSFFFDISNDIFNYECYEYYLKRLPSLSLPDVSFFFQLILNNFPLRENIFKIPVNYPSPFAKELLRETYGNVVYSHQLMLLLANSLPFEERSHNLFNEYRKQFGLRKAAFFDKINTLFLPDGFNVGKLLKEYTPIKNDNYEYGFVTMPSHQLAFEFIKRAKKYL